jgi:ABC-type Na+ efflux pump permease subunit
MKRILNITLSVILAFLIPAGIMNAQDKKNEQRVKIIVSDKGGTNIQIDTVINGDHQTDSIRLKNGEVIYLAKHEASATVKHTEGVNGQVFVMVTSDDKGEKGEKSERNQTREITIISGDSAHLNQNGESGKVIIVKGGKHFTEGKGGDIMTWSSSSSSSSGNSEGSNYIYINEGKKSGKKSEKTVDVKVTTDENVNNVEMTKYVIAKDGMVISIEGNDEAKVKDMVENVESKLGVNKEDTNSKTVVKEKTKKTTK